MVKFEKNDIHRMIKPGMAQKIKHSYEGKIQNLIDELEINQLVLETKCQALQGKNP